MSNIDTEVLDELVALCEESIGAGFKKNKPAPARPADEDDVNVDELASLYQE